MLLTAFLLALCGLCHGQGITDWSLLTSRPYKPTCVDIPKDMSLCSDIGYSKMRLPNLLEHDTLKEVHQQSGSWVPLLNVGCHPDTKLFLCSLFTPVCLESPILPCRSLCEAVQKGCENRMKTYGYEWPEMFKCEKYPPDNDMCIRSLSKQKKRSDGACTACGNPVDTYENILDNYCRADFVVRTKVKKQKHDMLITKKARAYKMPSNRTARKSLAKTKFLLKDEASCCTLGSLKGPVLIMARRKERSDYVPTFVLPWKKSKEFRKAVKMFKNLKCDDPELFTASLDESGSILPKTDKKEKKVNKRRNKMKQTRQNSNATSPSIYEEAEPSKERRQRRKKKNKKNEEDN